jgi:hypothetical protein
MVKNSLRQKVFELLDTNPELDNKDLYELYPKESENSLRTYRRDYFKELEKSISKMKISEKSISKSISNFPNTTIKNKSIFTIDKKSYEHFCSLLNTYYYLPLFIYSRILKKAFDQVDNIIDVNLSFYEEYMVICNDLSEGYLDDSLINFDSNVLEEMLRLMCKLDNMDYLEYIEYTDNELSEEYKEYKGWIEEDIELCRDRVMGYMTNFNLINPTLKEYKRLRSKLLYYLFSEYGIKRFYYRKSGIMKHDINLIVQEYNNNSVAGKLNFIEEVRLYNGVSITVDVDTREFIIIKERYIDLGKHGKEFEGVHNLPIFEDPNDPSSEIVEFKEEYFEVVIS